MFCVDWLLAPVKETRLPMLYGNEAPFKFLKRPEFIPLIPNCRSFAGGKSKLKIIVCGPGITVITLMIYSQMVIVE